MDIKEIYESYKDYIDKEVEVEGWIKKHRKQKEIGFKSKIDDKRIKDYFGLPFVNRIDKIVLFNTLNEDNILKIIKLNINKLRKKYKDVKIAIYKNVINDIVSMSNYKEYGARKISKIIKQEIEEYIINNIMLNNTFISIKSINNKQIIAVK